MAANAISIELIVRVREFYTMAYQEISSNELKQITHGNGLTDYAIPAYMLSVGVVEAFMNEMFLAIGPGFLKGSQLENISQDELQKLTRYSLRKKLVHIPELAFGQIIFNPDRPPLQDMNHLINVRNSFVHYKMRIEAEYKDTYDYLVKNDVARKSPDDPNRFWANDLCTVEGIRWAHNTVLTILKDIIDTAIKTNRHAILISMGTQTKNFFYQIPSPTEHELWVAWLKTNTKWKKV